MTAIELKKILIHRIAEIEDESFLKTIKTHYPPCPDLNRMEFKPSDKKCRDYLKSFKSATPHNNPPNRRKAPKASPYKDGQLMPFV